MTSISARSRVAACTIIAHNYLPLALILAKSYRQFHPGNDFYVVVVDHPLLTKNLSMDGVTFLSIDQIDLGPDGFADMATIYDVTEFSTSIKPFVLSQLLEDHECVQYLDPDIQIFDVLTPLIEATFEHGWSLTPHTVHPLTPRDAGPPEAEIMGAGIFNLGYIGVSRAAHSFLEWWKAHLRRDALIDQQHQMFTDQRWIDLAVPMFRPYIEYSPAYNVAYWNLDNRIITKTGDGTFLVNGESLRFFHFSGYDIDRPFWLSKYQRGQARVLMSDQPAFRELFGSYAALVKESNRACGDLPSYGWNDCLPGISFPSGLRRLFREELVAAERGIGELPPSPFRSSSVVDFKDWMMEQSPVDPRPISRVLLAYLRTHPGDDARFSFLEHESVRQDLMSWFHNELQRKEPVFRLFSSPFIKGGERKEVISDAGLHHHGVDVVGYVHAELGVGEAARRLVMSLQSVGVSTSVNAISRTASRLEHQFETQNRLTHNTVVLAVNSDQVPSVIAEIGDQRRKGRYVIGQWFWELEDAPTWAIDAIPYVDEVWVATEFMKKSVESIAPSGFPVTVMPVPLINEEQSSVLSRSECELGDVFTFVYVFDFLSVMKRKNPVDLVSAYVDAFKADDGASLLIKTINGDKRCEELEELRWIAAERSDIRIIDEYWITERTSALISHADCYVSLHRSEGLGLTLAEAMSFGRPVIATGYSGNMDFMTPENAFIVPWKYVPVGPDAEGYAATAQWAQPDLDEAARMMRWVFENREEALCVGERGQSHLRQYFSSTVTGNRMKLRLQSLGRIGL